MRRLLGFWHPLFYLLLLLELEGHCVDVPSVFCHVLDHRLIVVADLRDKVRLKLAGKNEVDFADINALEAAIQHGADVARPGPECSDRTQF